MSLPLAQIETKLSQMILDKKFKGILDAGAGCLIVYDDQTADETYDQALDTIGNMSKVISLTPTPAESVSITPRPSPSSSPSPSPSPSPSQVVDALYVKANSLARGGESKEGKEGKEGEKEDDKKDKGKEKGKDEDKVLIKKKDKK